MGGGVLYWVEVYCIGWRCTVLGGGVLYWVEMSKQKFSGDTLVGMRSLGGMLVGTTNQLVGGPECTKD